MLILCLRTYDNVTFPETHNAFATEDDGIFYPAGNHRTGLDKQWNAGMRAFMIDTHYEDLNDENLDGVKLCHGSDDRGVSPCIYGNVSAIDWLANLNDKMADNTQDVVTLLVENYVQPDHLEQVFITSGLMDRVFFHQLNQPWPTLQSMIDDGTNLVVFWEQGGDTSHPWIHDFLTHSWTTNFGESSTSEMNCDVLRGDGNQVVYHMNNWLSNQVGLSDPTQAGEANDVDFLVERANQCWQQHGKRPTFIAVDWWEQGDVVAAAEMINLQSEAN
jgi:hypothetical protein